MYTKLKKIFSVFVASATLVYASGSFGSQEMDAHFERKFLESNGKHLGVLKQLGLFPNQFGVASSFSTLGPIDESPNNPFFKPFGTNGRTCGTCHVQGEAFTITPEGVQARFKKTKGLDPIFRTNDGSNSPLAPVATLEQRKEAYSLLLNKGLIRIGMPMPTHTNDVDPITGAHLGRPAEFVLESVQDPYGFASASELSLFRRPLPATNLKFIASVMWDGRENMRDFTNVPLNSAAPVDMCTPNGPPAIFPNVAQWCYKSFFDALKNQANGATIGHAEAAANLSDEEKIAIVNFELSLFTAQELDFGAGFLWAGGAKGGGQALKDQEYYFDIGNVHRDPITGLPGSVSKLTAMDLFTPWLTDPASNNPSIRAKRESIARGAVIFNTRTFRMVNVQGTSNLNGTVATCTNCHATPNVGSLSTPIANFALGIGDLTPPAPGAGQNLVSPDLPVYTLRRVSANPALNGQIKIVQDPGLAMITGKWADIGRFKTPALRGLALRAPYFHDGSAKTIEEVTDFYLRRFDFTNNGTMPTLTPQEITDLNNFMKAL
jgi:cytochrome c peroxidase